MRQTSRTLFRVSAILAVLVSAAPAGAVDGVVLIDQNRAFAGSVTPGDVPGFPITITQPGSYRLAGNLTPPLGVTAIDITASNVTLDLNGFTVLALPHDPSTLDVGVSMNHPGVQNVTLRNGHVRGFSTPVEMPFVTPGNVLPTQPVPLKDLPPVAPVTLKDLTLLRVEGQQTTVRIAVPRGSLIQGVVAPRVALIVVCPSTLVGSVVDSVAIYPYVEAPSAQCAVADTGRN